MADPTRKAAVGFQGGQVLALRLSESQLKELRSVLREGRERWHEVEAADGAVAGRRRADRLPARRVRRAPRRLLSTPRQSLRVRANALDLALYKRIRSLARTPETVRWVRRFSALGEHGLAWLALGGVGALLDKPARPPLDPRDRGRRLRLPDVDARSSGRSGARARWSRTCRT